MDIFNFKLNSLYKSPSSLDGSLKHQKRFFIFIFYWRGSLSSGIIYFLLSQTIKIAKWGIWRSHWSLKELWFSCVRNLFHFKFNNRSQWEGSRFRSPVSHVTGHTWDIPHSFCWDQFDTALTTRLTLLRFYLHSCKQTS